METVEEIQNQSAEREENSQSAFNHAIDLLTEFQEKHDKVILLKAAHKLVESIRLEKNQIEPYFLLAYIFYILDNGKLALKYLKVAELIDPNFLEIKKLKSIILGIIL